MSFKRKNKMVFQKNQKSKKLTEFNFTVFVVVFLLRRHNILVSMSKTKQLYSG